jgi:CRISPR-associated protein Cas2
VNLTARTTYLVSYDVSDPRRLTRTRKTMLGFGAPVQLSVFRCELTARDMAEMRRALMAVIDARQDQVLIADLGPSDGRGREALSSLGRAYVEPRHQAVVV